MTNYFYYLFNMALQLLYLKGLKSSFRGSVRIEYHQCQLSVTRRQLFNYATRDVSAVLTQQHTRLPETRK